MYICMYYTLTHNTYEQVTHLNINRNGHSSYKHKQVTHLKYKYKLVTCPKYEREVEWHPVLPPKINV